MALAGEKTEMWAHQLVLTEETTNIIGVTVALKARHDYSCTDVRQAHGLQRGLPDFSGEAGRSDRNEPHGETSS